MRFRPVLVLVLVALAATILASPAGAGPGGKPAEEAPPASEAPPTEAPPTEAPPTEAALAGVVQVHTSYQHSCAVLANRQARCWGANSYGELGDGTTDASDTAVIVMNAAGTGPLMNVRQIVNGYDHTCALLTNAQVRCVGGGSDGQLGNGSFVNSESLVVVRNPTDTAALQDVLSIAAEDDGMCALLANRKVVCWGDDDYGQLGNGDPKADSNLPVFVKGLGGSGQLANVAALGGGYDTNCVLLLNGQGRCWGYNEYGGLGNGTVAWTTYPVVVQDAATGTALTGIVQITHNGYHGCATLNSGQARCWGYNNDGQLGTGDLTLRKRAVPVGRVGGGRLLDVASIFVGYDHTCALLDTGQARCWGDDSYGQNGDGTVESPESRMRPTPVLNVNGVGNLGGITQLYSRADTACVRLANGQARCWGEGDDGELGNGNDVDSPLPVVVQV